MHRLTSLFVLVLVAALPAIAEEISLKDGTKIVGHMTAVTADRIEVETSYGKIQLKRSDILSISFPENGAPSSISTSTSAPATAATAESGPAKLDVTKVEETVDGLLYFNRTGKFTLTLTPEWVVTPDIRRGPGSLAGLASGDKTRFLLVIREEYPGSLASYKELTLLNARKALGNFEELSEAPITVDGKQALTVFYRGTLPKGLPVEFISIIIPSGKIFTKLTAWCVEPLFHDMQPSLEKILSSYRTTGEQAATSSKP